MFAYDVVWYGMRPESDAVCVCGSLFSALLRTSAKKKIPKTLPSAGLVSGLGKGAEEKNECHVSL